MWAPYASPDGSVFVALAGKIALDEGEWQKAEKAPGAGGLACKAIFEKYQSEGSKALESLNGSYVVIIRDSRLRVVFIVMDGAGMFPCFIGRDAGGGTVICSHPDVLANALECGSRLDRVSLAEFLMTGKVSPPHTYYSEVAALDFGCVHAVDLNTTLPFLSKSHRYFDIRYPLNAKVNEWEFAEELAAAFRVAVQRRVSRRFGDTAVTLSGGMDSRAVLCAALQKMPVRVICFFDEKNFEYGIALRIARECNVELLPLQRDFDHYGNTAALGVKIYGGMGNILNNHFLGFRPAFKDLGVGNLLTGFYCDYMFKGLGLDRRTHPVTRLDQLAPFTYNWYRPCYWYDSPLAVKARERLEEIFPPAIQKDATPEGRLERERRRLFPLSYEPDNAETTIPQRVLPWDLPTVDADLLKVYGRMPPGGKLNCSIYSKTVELMCGRRVADIPNANTGARVGAQGFELVLHCYVAGLQNRLAKHFRKKITTRGSWPNWEHYLHHSPVIRELWLQPNALASELFREILGYNPFERPIEMFCGHDGVEQFSRLFTLKVWLDGSGHSGT
jgi:asparagine synthase (glutamine-hydrolysing)